MKNKKIVLGGFLLAFSGGATYSWGVFTVPLMNLFAWSKYEANLSFSVFMIVFALAMLPAGMLTDRFGARIVARWGALLFLPAYGLASLIEITQHPWWLPLTHGLFGGMSCACVYGVIAPTIRKYIRKNTSFAIALAVMGFGLASVFLAPIKASLLIPGLGVSGTLAILGLTVFLVSFSASFLLPDRKSDAPAEKADQFTVLKETLRKPEFYMIWIIFALSVVGGFLCMGLFPSFALRQLNADAGFSAVIISLFAGVNGFGRPLAGMLAEKAGFPALLLFSGVLQTLALYLLSLLPASSLLLIVVTIVTGWSFAVILGLFPSFTASVLGSENLGTRYGMVFTGFGLGSLALIGGSVLYDATGSFFLAFFLAGLAALLSVAALGILIYGKKSW